MLTLKIPIDEYDFLCCDKKGMKIALVAILEMIFVMILTRISLRTYFYVEFFLDFS